MKSLMVLERKKSLESRRFLKGWFVWASFPKSYWLHAPAMQEGDFLGIIFGEWRVIVHVLHTLGYWDFETYLTNRGVASVLDCIFP